MGEFSVWMMMLGILLIMFGCALVGRRKTIKKRYDPTYQIAHKYLPQMHRRAPPARACVASGVSVTLGTRASWGSDPLSRRPGSPRCTELSSSHRHTPPKAAIPL